MDTLNRLGRHSAPISGPVRDSVLESGRRIEDPFQHLVDCHDRIEEHLQILEREGARLASATAEERQEARQRINQALGFLALMGRLHTLDEEATLFPRLRASARAEDLGLGDLVVALESQHREKEAVFDELAALVDQFPSPIDPPSSLQVSRLEGYVAQLAGLYRPHIMLENARLIPLSRESLSAADLEPMAQEMRERFGLH
jgi:hemerythrin-like domain-containing protein